MQNKRILIIDDEMDFVKMLRARLQIEGYEVLTAEDGTKGIQVARKERPAVIILDIMMPGMDGHMVCDMLKKSTLTWSIPIIYLTAKTSQADEVLAMEKGAKYYLTKPYNPGVLLEMVRSAILETDQTEKKEDRILVIDKDLNFVSELEAKLKQAGYEVLLSPTAKEGLKAARKHHPEIILLDFLTSHEDSHASIKIISNDDSLKAIPLFILAPESIMAKVGQKIANLDKFITKPINYVLFLDTLERTLNMKTARAQDARGG
jgi:DNA-binding response OmpR family regulator